MFRTIFDRAPEGIVLVDVDTKQISDANSVMCRMLGYSHGEIVGLDFADIHPLDEREFIAEDSSSPNGQPDTGFSIRESPVVRRDGSIFYADIKGVRLSSEGKKYLSVFFCDITERKRAEEALLRNREELEQRVWERTLELSRSHEKYHNLFESASDGIFILDLEGHFLDANTTAYRRLGYTRDELLSMTISQLTPQEYAVRVPDRFSEIKENNVAVFESAHTRKDGTPMPVEVNARMFDYEGKQVYFSIIRDITERKEAEAKIRESEDRFRSIFEEATDGIMIADLENKKQIEANRAICKMLGYSRDELLSLRVEDLHPKEDLHRIIDIFERQARGEISLAADLPMRRKDGTIVYVDANSARVTLNGKPCMLGIFRDITERKEADNRLRESEARFRGAFENLKVGFSMVELDGRFMKANPFLCEMLGYSEDELRSITFSDVSHPDDVYKGRDAAAEMLEGGIDHTWVEKRYIRKDGGMIHGLTSIALIRDSKGDPAYFVGLWQDVTDKISAERDLKLFSYAMQQSMDGVQMVDLEGRIIYSNAAVHEIYGFSHDELLGRHVNEMNADAEFAGRVILPALRESGRWSGEVLVKHKEGREFPVWLSTSMVRDEQGEPTAMVGVIRDITERKRADAEIRAREKQLSESQRIAHIGSWEHNLTTGEVIWSDELFRLFGLDPQKDPADFNVFFSMIHPEDQPLLKKAIEETLNTGRHFSIEYRLILRDGRTRTVHAQAELRHDETGKQQILSGTGQDITESKEAENKLRESEARFRGAFESAAVGASMASLNGRFTKVNRFLCDMLGYSEEELLSRTFSDVTHPDDVQIGLDAGKKMISGEIDHTMFEKRYVRKDGTLINVVISPTIIRDGYGNPLHFFALFQDITERKKAEHKLKKTLDELGMRVEERTRELSDMIEKLNLEIVERKRAEETIEKSLREKEVLLKEIHHRVKNNMAIISSLLSLQEARTKNKESKEILIDFQNRIKTLSLVHEKLLSSDDFGAIHLRDYITSLTSNVLSSFSDDEADIESAFKIEQVVLDMDRLIPFGLILNEIITNTIKHAFDKIDKPKMSIMVTKTKKYFTLTVQDNGNGIPKGVDILKSNALGGKIIKTLVRQLKGEMKVASGKKGTSIEIRCPI